MDAEARTKFLREAATALTSHFGDGLFIRLGPTLEPWRRSVVLEVFGPNTSSAPVLLEADEHELYLTIGDAIDCVLFEKHALGADAFEWAAQRIISAGEHGVEMWRDRRRHLFGGQHEARILGEPFFDVSDKRRARLSLGVTTEPWTVPDRALLADPVAPPDRDGTAFLVDSHLPQRLQEIATTARKEFGAAISIVTRMDELCGAKMLEVLPVDREASRMRIKQLKSGAIGLGTGDDQYFEYEFAPVPAENAMEWVVDAGRFGLLETMVRRGPVYWFVNEPATPEAIEAAESNPRAGIQTKWKPWARTHD